MSCSASNTIFVIVMRQKEWKMTKSQHIAVVPIPLQGSSHPKKNYLKDRQCRARVRAGTCQKPCIQRAPEAFCVIQRAETLRAGDHTQKTARNSSFPSAPSGSSWVQLIKKKTCSCCKTHTHSPSLHFSYFYQM